MFYCIFLSVPPLFPFVLFVFTWIKNIFGFPLSGRQFRSLKSSRSLLVLTTPSRVLMECSVLMNGSRTPGVLVLTCPSIPWELITQAKQSDSAVTESRIAVRQYTQNKRTRCLVILNKIHIRGYTKKAEGGIFISIKFNVLISSDAVHVHVYYRFW